MKGGVNTKAAMTQSGADATDLWVHTGAQVVVFKKVQYLHMCMSSYLYVRTHVCTSLYVLHK